MAIGKVVKSPDMNKAFLRIKETGRLLYDSGAELSRDYGNVHAAALGIIFCSLFFRLPRYRRSSLPGSSVPQLWRVNTKCFFLP